MAEIMYVVKIVAISQIIIISLLLLFAYLVKIYSYYQPIYYQRLYSKLEQLLLEWMKHPRSFKDSAILRYKRNIELLLLLINTFDESKKTKGWEEVRAKLVAMIIMPSAERLAQSRAWKNRYIACRALQLSTKNINECLLKSLIHDPVPLVAINAVMIALQIDSQSLIDSVIDTFANSRRLQQSLYTEIISSAKAATIIPLIRHRLSHEHNPYIKAFCYRTLAHLPPTSEPCETVKADFDIDNLDLKLSILTYIAHIHPKTALPFLTQQLHHDRWQIRARVAKLIGDIGKGSSAYLLEESLKDPTWWVRINAAEALAKLGKKGMTILKKQRPEIDQFAYDVAIKILSIEHGKYKNN